MDCRLGLGHAQTVIQILVQISRITTDTEELKQRYGLIVEVPASTTSIPDTARTGYIDSSRVFHEQYLQAQKRQSSLISSVQRGTTVLKKLRWVFTDKETMLNLVTTLRGFNDSLSNLLEDTARYQFRNDFQALCLETSSTNDLLKLQVIESASRDRYKEMSLPASHKILRLRLELEYAERFESRGTDLGGDPRPMSLRVPSDDVHILQPTAPRSIVMYQNTHVMIEWREFGEVQSLAALNQGVLERLQHVTKLLHRTTPKPEEFRVLSCHGFILEEVFVRFAFLFELPPRLSDPSMPKLLPESLHDLLSADDPSRHRPSQTSRFLLAKRLASSLLHLHSTGWVHKGIRSQNIVLLGPGDRKSAASISKLIEEPYLTGFEYSRLSSAFDASEPVDNDPVYAQYRHPDVQGDDRARFRKKYDAYSLGLVLVEIAYWKPLQKLFSLERTGIENARRLRRHLVDSGDLSHWMGEVYSRVVVMCLSCEWETEDFHLEFFEKVVKELDRCEV